MSKKQRADMKQTRQVPGLVKQRDQHNLMQNSIDLRQLPDHTTAVRMRHASILQLQQQQGNTAVQNYLQIQRSPAACTLATPGGCASYNDWLDTFPNHGGGADKNITDVAGMPDDLKGMITGKLTGAGTLPDCADVAFVLRHYYLKAKGKTFSFLVGRNKKTASKFTLGKGVTEKEVKKCMLGGGTTSFQEERKDFALVDFYKKKGSRVTNLKELIRAGLKPGDMFVWKRRSGVTGNFSGHAQTIQKIDKVTHTIDIVQGNMVHGKGVGELQHRQYTFEQLTGQADGDAEIKSTDEEDFHGAGPWK